VVGIIERLSLIPTAIRAWISPWSALLSEEAILDAQLLEINQLLTRDGASTPSWLLWSNHPETAYRELAKSLTDYANLKIQADKIRYTSKLYFRANLDARQNRMRSARSNLVFAMELFKRPANSSLDKGK
jgi:hypothetical protein